MNVSRKIMLIIIIFTIIFTAVCIFEPINFKVEAKASRSAYTGLDENKYPGYNSLIQKLKSEHPNWNFTILYTGLDWNQVIKSENSGHGGSPLNLIQNKTGEWLCSICGTKTYDNGSWNCASERTIAYIMDPRNSLNNMDVFQFEEVTYKDNIHTIDGVKSMTTGTFIAGDSVGQAILTACKNANISPYYVISRILQEQGRGGSTTGKGMKDDDGNTYYNVFNVGASGNNSSQIIANAKAKAKENGWTTLESSILGGIGFLKTKYVDRGQNTLYLNKFDIDDSDGTLYSHQYMQNVQAARSEASSVYKIYSQTGKINENYNFIIPVYENMPKMACFVPSSSSINPVNVIVATEKDPLIVRDGPGTGYKEITRIAKGTVVLSIERESNKDGWDKVVLDDATIGYVYSQYLSITDDVTNCNDTMVVNIDGIEVRSGPGYTNTSLITTVNKGQIVTRIDTNRYQRDGEKWDRIILSDGRQGFIVNKSLGTVDTTDNVTVIANDGLRLRSGPGTSYSSIRTLAYGLVVTRVEKAASVGEGGYYWDKVITPDGIVGYVARQYLKDNVVVAQNGYKIDENAWQVVMEPKTLLKNLKDSGNNVTKAVDKDNNALEDTGLIGTGARLTINGKDYTVVKLGDVNGDGEVDIIDMALVKRDIIGTQKLDSFYKTAGNISTEDNEIDIIDMALIKRNIIGTGSITL